MAGCTDVHAHIFPAGLPDLAAVHGESHWPALHVRSDRTGTIVKDGGVYREVDDTYWVVEPRLEWLATMGIDRQVVSPLPVLLTYWAPQGPAAEFAHQQNEAIAAFVAQAPSQLVGFGTVALQDPTAAVAELDAITALGLAGVEIGTRTGDRELDHPELRPLFVAAAEKGIPILLHAMEGAGLGRMDNLLVRFGIGVPADTGITAALLLLSSVFEDAPGLRLSVCHGGGSFFWSLPRLTPMVRHVLGSEAEQRLVAATASVFVDTASMGPENLDYLRHLLRPDQLLLGSDFPATKAVSPLEALSDQRFDSIRHDVLVDNAARFITGT